MRTRIAALLVTLLGAATGATGAAAPAQAVGGETLGCRLSPGETYFANPCNTQIAASTYSLSFYVQNSVPGTTYAWSLSGQYVGPMGGCGSGDNFCTMYVYGVGGDRTITANVTLTGGGQSVGLSAEATVPAICGTYLC